jgi:hypothetical protein
MHAFPKNKIEVGMQPPLQTKKGWSQPLPI